MNLNICIFCVVASVLLAVPAMADSTATIHGEVYGWDTFEPLKNAVVEVNSTPSQSMVAKYGVYSFELEPGDYLIKASYYRNSTLTYSAEEPVIIKGKGSYVLDLLLLPVYSEELMDSSEREEISENPADMEGSSSITQTASNSSGVVNTSDTSESGAGHAGFTETGGINRPTSSIGYHLLAALMLSLLLAGGYRLQKHKNVEKNRKSRQENNTKKFSVPASIPDFSARVSGEIAEPKTEQKLPTGSVEPTQMPEIKKTPGPETPALKKNLPLPADLQQVMDIIRGQGGRITQKDLRSKLKYSEGKVSLMLADLERRELIEKFKRGRGNVIILKDR